MSLGPETQKALYTSVWRRLSHLQRRPPCIPAVGPLFPFESYRDSCLISPRGFDCH